MNLSVNKKKKIKLQFDNSEKYGSKEHFWHFMLGYLLPSINRMIQYFMDNTIDYKKEYVFYFDDCGPLMNNVIDEFAKLLNFQHDYCSPNTSHEKDNFIIICVPRWDITLRNSSYYRSNVELFGEKLAPLAAKISHLIGFRNVIPRELLSDIHMRTQIRFTRNYILKKITDSIAQAGDSYYLLLDRSDMHRFYSKEGEAEKKGYGKSRRSFINLEAGYYHLKNNDIPLIIYEPGADSIINQIRTFNSSKGVIGLRGAEMANLIWLNHNSKVVVINTIKGKPVHLYNYARILGIKISVLPSKSNHPDIAGLKIEDYL